MSLDLMCTGLYKEDAHFYSTLFSGREAIVMSGLGNDLEWITTTEEIVKALIASRDNGKVIGITALSFGPTMIMTAVDDIIDVKNDKIVLLKEHDLLGIKLPESELLLSEIVRVHPLRTKYYDPFHVHLRGEDR